MAFKDVNETEKQLPSQFVAKEREKLKNIKPLFLRKAVDYSGIFGFRARGGGGGGCL
jgi:hypothetical protein